MSKPTVPTTSITLANTSQWYTWVSIIRSCAKQADIWHLIDPSLPTEPLHNAPTLPKKATTEGADAIAKSDNYADALLQYNFDCKEYRDRKAALTQTLKSIQTTISSEYLAYILDKTSPYEALKTLSKAIEPDSSVRVLAIGDIYRVLCDGPPKGQNLRLWINKWEKNFVDLQEVKHTDVESGYILDLFVRSLEPSDQN